ncbi:ATP-binding cassette domain-containing protein [Piscinibacter koreensis]|uniref:ABC transporter ATP-binding protein n=1 Tax=Piscinibacter koreensis TaxID=2742824 RepID=A0A7Y6TXL3_9BURK|nr:ABC transporter ATP-binding protein [Schlegelella koreensis]
MSFLAFEGVTFGFPGAPPVVDGIDLAIAPGEFHCLVGRSGCGKTTLLRLAAGLVAPRRGRVLVDGSTAIDQRRVGFVFQAPTLLEWRTVLDNVLLPVALQRRPTPADVRQAEALLAQLGLARHAARHPRQLSGGQQSRVALARALLPSPPLLLLDEPFAALDAITREELQHDLLRLAERLGTTVLFVTHDIAEAVYLGDRVSVLAGGRLRRTVPVPLEVPRQPGTRESTGFVAACAVLRAALGVEAVAA